MEFNSNGCFIALMAFMSHFISGCIAKGIGVLLPTLRDQLVTHTWIIGIVGALMGVASDVAGLSTLPLENLFGYRRVTISCSIVGSFGMILLPSVTNPVHIALALAVLVGPSLGIFTVLGKALVGRHFSKQYALACGVAYAGQALSLLAVAPMTQVFLDTYGWRGAMLLIAGICIHMVPSAIAVKVIKAEYDPISYTKITNTDQEYQERSEGAVTLCIKAFSRIIRKNLDLTILLEFNFWIVATCRFSVSCVFTTWLLYFVPHLQVKGFSPQVAASICSAGAVGSLIGSIIWSPFVDRGLITSTSGMVLSSLALTLSFVLDPWVTDFISCLAVTLAFGVFASSVYTLVDVMTKEILGKERLVSAFGWMRAFFLPRLIAGFVPG
ncbi:monocarboxylate transporter 12-like [Acanthaster planci]|uniref:Monocarboxylate transporter 12-like n=1 Tax=Acanthaster planci TaxID=133434 RepID=A0A8B7ZHL0_ACAPL|nr:monocarboxylate transporter 12-like [Acanthaster planci]